MLLNCRTNELRKLRVWTSVNVFNLHNHVQHDRTYSCDFLDLFDIFMIIIYTRLSAVFINDTDTDDSTAMQIGNLHALQPDVNLSDQKLI